MYVLVRELSEEKREALVGFQGSFIVLIVYFMAAVFFSRLLAVPFRERCVET